MITYDPEDYRALIDAEDSLIAEMDAAVARLQETHPNLFFTRLPHGVAPQQAEGTYNGLPFYFRIRLDAVTFELGAYKIRHENVTGEPYAGFLHGHEFEETFENLLHAALDH